MTSIGDLELKGLTEPVPTFDVGWDPADGVADLRDANAVRRSRAEREVLAGRLAAARDGAGGLVLIAGEPGIGKTRLAAEVCAQVDDLAGAVRRMPRRRRRSVRAVRRGAHRLGPAHADRRSARRRSATTRRSSPGWRPAIREVVPDVGEPLPVPPDAETARLHDAVGQVLDAAQRVRRRSSLIVEDLHWADDATVGMLRVLPGSRRALELVVIGTYRETDLDRRHPFAARAPAAAARGRAHPHRARRARRRRRARAARTAVGPRGAGGVRGAARDRDRRQPVLPARDAAAPRRRGSAARRGRRLGRRPTGELSIPAGVRDVVGRRLSRLSPDANRLLAAGALFEVSFPLAIVAAVTEIDEDDALDAIDEALDARIVAATDEFDRYAFTHALFRHTLVEELNPSRQVRMHRAIAEAIEKDLRGAPDPATAATLARHYLRSAAIPGRRARRAVRDRRRRRRRRPLRPPRGARRVPDRARAARTARRSDDRAPPSPREAAVLRAGRSRRAAARGRGRRPARRRRRRRRRRVRLRHRAGGRGAVPRRHPMCWRLAALGRRGCDPSAATARWAFLRDTELRNATTTTRWRRASRPTTTTTASCGASSSPSTPTTRIDSAAAAGPALAARPKRRSRGARTSSRVLRLRRGRGSVARRRRGRSSESRESASSPARRSCSRAVAIPRRARRVRRRPGKPRRAIALLPRIAPESNAVFQVLPPRC